MARLSLLFLTTCIAMGGEWLGRGGGSVGMFEKPVRRAHARSGPGSEVVEGTSGGRMHAYVYVCIRAVAEKANREGALARECGT